MIIYFVQPLRKKEVCSLEYWEGGIMLSIFPTTSTTTLLQVPGMASGP